MAQVRLDKFLAANGYGTRSEIKKRFKTDKITVNGRIAAGPEMKIDDETDRISVNGETICYEPFLCLMLNKPAGCVTAVSDPIHKTVADYIHHPRREELFPVGRLDIDTEGLLLFMNDGPLAHRLLSPRHHAEKTYFVRVQGEVTEEDGAAFLNGIDIGEKKNTLPAQLKILSAGSVSEAELTICEGKFHQVKRMFAARGKQVLYLKRIAMAGIALDPELEPGAWRELTAAEKEHLKNIC